jgi:4-alpha-glucanotransferase
VLAALGERPEDTPVVHVAWDGVLLPAAAGPVDLEDGGRAGAGEALPPGFHRLAATGETVVSAPRRVAPFPPASWGVFAPTYALRDRRRLPHGDLTALGALGRLTAELGGSYVATLPLLAKPVPRPGDPPASPYSPVSRMWWDEGFLDLQRLPEVAAEAVGVPPGATAHHASAERLLMAGAARVALDRGPRGQRFRSFLERRPDVRAWGVYRAGGRAGGADRHVYAQWATDEQLGQVAARMGEAGCLLLLDLPVGCRPDGYDPRAFPASFATGASIGAPPDRFFLRGQDWGLAPLHPEGERSAGYPVLRAALAHALRHAGALRIDHVMGLQRLWWIPAGAPPAEGAYVSYPAEELLSVACLEACRAGVPLVGEDLGTVAPALRRLLAAHGIGGTDVAIFSMEDDPARPLSPRRGSMATVDTHDTATLAGWLAADDVAIRLRLGLLDEAGAVAAAERRADEVATLRRRLRADRRLAARAPAEEVAGALLEELGASDAGLVVATLEDLWGEREPQNVPGTVDEHANFSRPLARSLEEVSEDLHVRSVLRRLDQARRGAG